MPPRIEQLIQDGIWIRPPEAAALVRCTWEVRETSTDPSGPIRLAAPRELTLDETGLITRNAELIGPWLGPHEGLRALAQLLHRLLLAPGAPPSAVLPPELHVFLQRLPSEPHAAGVDRAARPGTRRFRSPEEFVGALRVYELTYGYRSLRPLHERWLARRRWVESPTFEGLRQLRESAEVSLAEITARTRIPPVTLEALEAGRFSQWPGGVFGRQYARAYAAAIGLDPELLLRALEPHVAQDESIAQVKEAWDLARKAPHSVRRRLSTSIRPDADPPPQNPPPEASSNLETGEITGSTSIAAFAAVGTLVTAVVLWVVLYAAP